MPFLRAGLGAENPVDMRQGVCLGLAEVLACTTRRQIEDYQAMIIGTVQA